MTRLSGTAGAVTSGATYGPFNVLVTASDPLGHTVTVTPNTLGQAVAIADPLGHAATFGYAPSGQVQTATNALTAVTQGTAVATIAYDAANRRTGLTLPGGVSVKYSYDTASELTGITFAKETTTLGTLTYGYDAAGRVSSRGGTLFKTVLAGSSTATYDIANRLTSRTSVGVTVTPVWDKAGELTSDGSRTYGWDARGRLASLSGVATYQYDPLGRRSLLAPISGPATSYLYDGPAVIQEQQGGVASANLLNGPGADEHYTRATTGTGAATSTYLADALGSTVALTSATGAIATRYGYDAYGTEQVKGMASA